MPASIRKIFILPDDNIYRQSSYVDGYAVKYPDKVMWQAMDYETKMYVIVLRDPPGPFPNGKGGPFFTNANGETDIVQVAQKHEKKTYYFDVYEVPPKKEKSPDEWTVRSGGGIIVDA